MIYFCSVILFVALGLFFIPVLVLFVQAVAAFPMFVEAPASVGRRPSVAILIPAHNEGAGLGNAIASVLPQLQEGDRLLVIADNCSDNTATIALAEGAEVCVRFDEEFRGKGYALDFGVRFLEANPPEVLIIVDADCVVTDGAIDRISRVSIFSGRPVQALYLMRAPKGSGPMKKLAELAWIVKNLVRPLGFYRLRMPCQLMGSGMAFPWAIISSSSLANGHIVEDLKLGLDLAKAGVPPLFCPDALVYSMFPSSAAGTASQRRRWEHGHISMILSEAPALIREGLSRKNLGLFMLALDLCVPPLALLALLVLALFSFSVLFGIVSGIMTPLVLATFVFGAFGTAILMSWWRFGRTAVSALTLCISFFYMLWKIPLYIRFFLDRQVEWVRSKRDSE